MTKVAVIGAGWAGSAAALTLARAGAQVTVFEAAKTVGGRARGIAKDGRNFDNGQHLLLGAYERCISMIASLHATVDAVLLRLPLALNTAPAIKSPLKLHAPRVIAPLHLLAAIITAQGLSPSDKLSTLIWSAIHLRASMPVDLVANDATVSNILASQPEPVRRLLWEPLCIAALNTPPEAASARVFIDMLRLTFMANLRASDLIIPRVDLSQLLPTPALAEVVRLGGEIKVGQPVVSITQNATLMTVSTRDEALEFDRVVIATAPQNVARLLGEDPVSQQLAVSLSKLQYEPITTLHFEFAWATPTAITGMLMLDGDPGQWLFWQRLSNGHWRASVVISAHHRSQSEGDLIAQTLAQLQCSYALPIPTWHLVITEKRATYACTPTQYELLSGLCKQIGKLYFAGDWCCPYLPATLEAAVISGENAAQLILEDCRNGR